MGLFNELTSEVSRCQIQKKWVASLITWYNLTPLYPALVQQLLSTADRQHLQMLTELLPKMK